MNNTHLQPLTKKEINDFIKKYPKVKFINCLVVDMLGLVRGKQISIKKLASICEPTVALPKSILLQNSMGENFKIPSISSIDPDYFAHAVSGTLWPALWSDTSAKDKTPKKKSSTPIYPRLEADPTRGHVFLNLMDNRGRPFLYNGRQLVSKMADLIYQDFGYRVNLAIELEFYMFAELIPGSHSKQFKKTLQHYTHIHDFELLEPTSHLYHYPYFTQVNSDCYGIDGLEDIAPMTEMLQECLSAQGITTDGVSSEYGSGQFEVNLKYINDPVHACDQAILLKHTIKSVAKQFGVKATFMAVPTLKSPNGMHINLSLADEAGNNVFYTEPKKEKGKKVSDRDYISDTAMYCIGGLEKTSKDGMLLFAPNFNSYKRYYCQGYSPGNIASWGINNRTVSIRIPAFNKKNPEAPKAMRLEHRLAGADSNPYLATAAVLGGIYLGLKRKIKPSRIERQSTYQMELWESEIPSMMQSLQDWKRRGNMFHNLFGKDFMNTFYEHRITEWNYFLSSLSQQDFDWYSQY